MEKKNLSFITATAKEKKYYYNQLRIPIERAKDFEKVFLHIRGLAIENEEFKKVSKAQIISLGVKNIIEQLTDNKNDIKKLIEILEL